MKRSDCKPRLQALFRPAPRELAQPALQQALQRWDGRSVHDIPVAHFYDLPEREGQAIEISYPCGQVGLVRQVDGLTHQTPERTHLAEKTPGGFER